MMIFTTNKKGTLPSVNSSRRGFFMLVGMVILFLAVLLSTHSNAQTKDFHNWAPTPPMGWNSWDCFGPTVVESEVKANADYMAKNLRSLAGNILWWIYAGR